MKFDSAVYWFTIAKDKLKEPSKRTEVQKRMEECRSGASLVSKPKPYLITNLGSSVNSPYEDYAPAVDGAERLMIFTSRRPLDGKSDEDIYLSTKSKDWTPAVRAGSPLNGKGHNSALSLSADGRQLLLYTEEHQGDILVSQWNGSMWSTPQPLPFPINTMSHESSACFSSDGQFIYVASERPGGFGGSDIYRIEKNPAGQWSRVTNLGAAINTPYDEDSPFADFDGKTFYFSSRGHNSMGGYDIFRTTIQNGVWRKPENLGYPVNTPNNDIYFIATADGRRGYFSSSRPGGLGEEDIYLITLPPEFVRPAVDAAPRDTSRPKH